MSWHAGSRRWRVAPMAAGRSMSLAAWIPQSRLRFPDRRPTILLPVYRRAGDSCCSPRSWLAAWASSTARSCRWRCRQSAPISAPSLVDAQWISNGYMLFLSALVLLGGAAGDVFGVRNIFGAGIAVFVGDVARLRDCAGCAVADRDASRAGHRRRVHGARQPGHHRQGLSGRRRAAGQSATGRRFRR